MDPKFATPPPLPRALAARLARYRAQLWRTKSFEAVLVALLAAAVSFVALLAVDRLLETPSSVRAALLALGLGVGALFVPRQLLRWVARHRTNEALARRIGVADVALGDRFLGVLELTRDSDEFRRAPELCHAAVEQGERDLGRLDLTRALPRSRHRGLALAVVPPLAVVACVAVAFPGLARATFSRWISPFGDTPRFTFARLVAIDEPVIVPHHERVALRVALAEDSGSRPASAQLVGPGFRLDATLAGDGYSFELPPLDLDASLRVSAGDASTVVEVVPTRRPEVLGALARVALPDYLELPSPEPVDVRGGTIASLVGSELEVALEFERNVSAVGATALTQPTDWTGVVTKADVAVDVEGARATLAFPSTSSSLVVHWTDDLGLDGPAPFELTQRPVEDAAPAVITRGIERSTLVRQDATLTFEVHVSDDYGVHQVGLEWEGYRPLSGSEEVQRGEKLLAGGAPDADTLVAKAVFDAGLLGIEPDVLRVRAWAIDRKPGRERSYSRAVTIRVLDDEEHMEWLTRRLGRWTDEVAESRDVERALADMNEELASLSDEELVTEAAARSIAEQLRRERENAERVDELLESGRSLLAEAMSNPEFNSNVIDDWATALDALESLANRGMPSVASELQRAAAEARAAASARAESQGGEGSEAGEDAAADGALASSGAATEAATEAGEEAADERAVADGEAVEPDGEGVDELRRTEESGSSGGASSAADPEESHVAGLDRSKPGSAPAADDAQPEAAGEDDEMPQPFSIQDKESSVAEAPSDPGESAAGAAGPPPGMGLVTTQLGPGAKQEGEPAPCPPPSEAARPTREALDAAAARQRELIAQFDEIADQFADLLEKLEGSTFVKRFKRASRRQSEAAEVLDGIVFAGFAVDAGRAGDSVSSVAETIARAQNKERWQIGAIHSDLDAYVERLESRGGETERHRAVLDELIEKAPATSLHVIADAAGDGRPGEALGTAEFWSDTLDRWAEELVGPG